MKGPKISLRKFEKIEIIPTIFSGHISIKLEINNKSKAGTSTNMWKLKNPFLINQRIKEEFKRKMISKQMKMETEHSKFYAML